MAKKKKTAVEVDENAAEDKLTKKQPDFYKVLGSIGGRATAANKGPLYFSRIARLSHVSRRRRAAERAAQKESAS